MRISMISEHASPLASLGGVDAGGQNVHVAALAGALAARGHRVTVFTRRDDPELPRVVHMESGIDVVHVDAGTATRMPKDDMLPLMPQMGRGIAAHWWAHPSSRPDVVHSHFWMSGIAGRAALDAADCDDVPLVHTFHALGTVKRRHQGPLDTSPPERRILEPGVGHDATAILATCADEIDELEAMGIDRDKATVIPCGVDLDRFAVGCSPEIDGGARRIVSVGRMVARKGMDIVLRGLALLRERGYDDVEFHVVGGAPRGNAVDEDPEARRLLELADDLGVADALVLHGQVEREDVPDILRSARLVACTPWYEPFGIVPLEAMACGVPVIAARVGGLQDTVVDGVTGYHVPPQDPSSFADAAARLLDDPALARRMGENGAQRVRRYAWPTIAEETETAYWRATGTGPSARLTPRALREPNEAQPPASTPRPGPHRTTGVRHVAVPVPDLASAEAPDPVLCHLRGVSQAVVSLACQSPRLQSWSARLAQKLTAGHRLLTAGNGGSAAEAQHLSAELVGRYCGDRPAYSAIALSTDSSAVTAIGNDYGYAEVFARQIEAHGRRGDVLILLSTSGKSPNLLRAAATARERGVETWALTGPSGTPLGDMCDEVVAIDAEAPHVQEAHLMAVHSLCAAFDQYIAAAAPDRSQTLVGSRATNGVMSGSTNGTRPSSGAVQHGREVRL